MNALSRRGLLAIAPAVALLPAPRTVNTGVAVSDPLAVRFHSERLILALRREFDPAMTRLIVTASQGFGDDDRIFISAMGLKKGWEVDARFRGGGFYVERSVGEWNSSIGFIEPRPRS